MRCVRLATILTLVIISVGVGLAAVKGIFGQAVDGPTPMPPTFESALPEIPMPTVPLAQDVLATLPPVEVEKLIHPPPVSGSQILYIRYERSEKGGSSYHVLDPQTGHETNLEPFPPDQYSASLELTMHASPTGERILYSVFFDFFALYTNPAAGEMGSIWTMNPDGSDKRQLVGSDELYFPANAIWSPDGQKIAFLRLPDPRAVKQEKLKAEQAELWVMNADGSQQRKVADLPYIIDHIFGGNPSMQWLLDDHIYIVTGIVFEGYWLRIDPYTGKVTPLAKNVQPWDVEISPDTQWIVVAENMSATKITALGRQPLNLPSIPAWDQTGEKVAFLQFPYPYDPDPKREPGIWVRNLRTGQETRLTALDGETSARCDRLFWSLDGSMLLCDAIEGLYVIWIERDEGQLVIKNPWAQENVAGTKFIGWVPVSSHH